MRMIAGIPFYCYDIRDFGYSGELFQFRKEKRTVCWTIPSQHLFWEWIRDFKKAILGD